MPSKKTATKTTKPGKKPTAKKSPVTAKKKASPSKPAKKPVAKAAPAKSSKPVKSAQPVKKAAAPVKAPAHAPAKVAKPAPAAQQAKPAATAVKAEAKSAIKVAPPTPPAKPSNAKPVPAAAPVVVAKATAAPKPVKSVISSPTASVSKAKDNAVVTANDDEGEALEISLLAGPRNVKPYQVRRGEEYMSKEQLTHFRTILQSWKNDLMQEVDRTVLHMKDEAANFPDPNDRATQESEFSLELRTRDRERKLIRKIEEAINRIDDGSYGYCMETGEEIGIKRLEARPVATLCLEAQERRERRERQYGDRDDRYR